ncbi:hypothetical protein HS088_TW09G00181 [Tripterygium wilfordii]|uniref:Uncharacterized protein n=1 Tax=Tripterygium wilfordii TaxID=458696 RepID=A0A7J7D7D2_TRIWF|nr:uncharacterized protein LOC120006484 [Tripterygium wilfordii]KAF5742139.1 hypothetical protein HS088_TW09G00181 [Tripterygium wilfordii]
MDSPSTLNHQHPRVLSPCSIGRGRSSTDSDSPEFEFWMVRNPSFPQPNLLSADELFVDGVLLPLHLLDSRPETPHPEPESEQNPEIIHQEKQNLDPPDPEVVNPVPEQEPGPHITSESTSVLSMSKRWKDIFKKGEKSGNAIKKEEEKDKEKEKEKKKKKEKKSHSGSGGAELNINIWPFSRSRSAGNETRPRWVSGASATGKVSSAPCSRSNSSGESKSRKWPNSPSQAGVHLGRSSPIWHVPRGTVKSSDPVFRIGEKLHETRRGKGTTTSGGTKVLNLNVPMCIGYQTNLSCRSDDNRSEAIGRSGGGKIDHDYGGGGGGGDTNNVGSSANLFNLRSLFTKKVY